MRLNDSTLPARKDVLVRELAEEVLIYDSTANTAHCLNRTAAFVWKHCDGQTTVKEMLTCLRKEYPLADEAVIWVAIDELRKAGLLVEPINRPANAKNLLAVRLERISPTDLPLLSKGNRQGQFQAYSKLVAAKSRPALDFDQNLARITAQFKLR